VARLKKLGVEVNNELLAKAFTSSHSTAEVYRLETIEKIFGAQDALDPDMLAELIQQMRANLAGVWRDPALQKDKKTNRRPQDIQAEVMRGYELARATVDGALAHHPDSWGLCLAHAALMHDENDYAHELKKDSGFSSRREAAFEEFKRAADLYAAKASDLDKDKETTKVYEIWFYAALGACDLGALNHEKQLASGQIPRIKEALQALPKDRAERHMDMFTNALFTRMSSVGPTVKFRYVREGLAIVGDHKLAREVHQLYDYYKDLVTEIRLDVRTDGSAHVGHDEPFGVFIDLEHTREIERESGGFAKYLTNQNSQGYFSWNYGRPTEDYRDKFEEAAREALGEHFEVVSVTFNRPETHSKALPEYGWRVTPYAYLLLKPRGPEVDRIPPLRLDLDFLDTTGYAVIPIESAPVPIVASDATGEARPFSKLRLTQTLDERRAREGVLAVEIKGTALGLLPKLETLLDWQPAEFDLVKSDDAGASVIKFDDEGADTAVVSERTWNVTLRAKQGLAHRPREFAFAKPRVEVAGMEQFRYADADLKSVGATVELEQSYGTPSRRWLWWIPVGLVVLVGAGLLARRALRRTTAAPGRFQMPERVTSFTVLGLLRTMARENGFQPSDQQALGREIERLERFYFAGGEGEPPDLKHIAEEWLARCRR
jgi:hypothetical protein